MSVVYSEGPFQNWLNIGFPSGAQAEAEAALFTVTDGRMRSLEPIDLAFLFRNLLLQVSDAGDVGTNGVGVNSDITVFYVSWMSDAVAAFDLEGEEIWRTDLNPKDTEVGLAVDSDYVYVPVRLTTSFSGDTVGIAVLDASSGSLVNTEVVLVNASPNTDTAVEGFASRIDGGTLNLYILYLQDIGSNLWDVFVSRYTASSGVLTHVATRAIESSINLGAEDRHSGLSRGPSRIYSQFVDVSESGVSRIDALNPSTLADEDDDDYTPSQTAIQKFSPPAGAVDGVLSFYEIASGGAIQRYKKDGTLLATADASLGTINHLILRDDSARAQNIALDAVADQPEIADTAYSKQLTWSGSPTVFQKHVGPASMTVSSGGLVEWASPSGSSIFVSIYATDLTSFHIVEWTIGLVVDEAPVIDAISDDSAAQFTFYTVEPTLSAGNGTITWSLDTAPDPGDAFVTNFNTATGRLDAVILASASTVLDWTIRATNVKDFDTESWQTTVTA